MIYLWFSNYEIIIRPIEDCCLKSRSIWIISDVEKEFSGGIMEVVRVNLECILILEKCSNFSTWLSIIKNWKIIMKVYCTYMLGNFYSTLSMESWE